MTVTALPSRAGSSLVGGYGPAHAAKEALTRSLSAELAPRGIRVVGLRPHGIPETASMREVYELKGAGMTWEQFQAYLAGTTHPRRVMTLREVADVAVFMASDRASGMTGTHRQPDHGQPGRLTDPYPVHARRPRAPVSGRGRGA